jgi:heme exporter protein CcmD
MNIDEFLNMGGYARFVWPSYLLGLIVLGGNVWSALRMHAAARARALKRAAAQPGTARDGAAALGEGA